MHGRELIQYFIRTNEALGAFNVFNAESVRAVSRAVEESQGRAYIQTSASTVQYYGAQTLARMIAALAGQSLHHRLALHLDHCLDLELIAQCIDAGWDSIMIDASAFPLEENIRRTREAVERAHRAGVAVEGEIGAVGHAEDGFEAGPTRVTNQVTAENVEQFVIETSVDLVAIGVGTKHGFYDEGACRVNVDLLKAAQDRCPRVPFVLHGGSGIPRDQVRAAIVAGVRKINISTDIKDAYLRASKDYLCGSAPYNVIQGMERTTEAICHVIKSHVTAFRSMGGVLDEAQV